MKRVVALTVAALGVLAIVGAIAVAHEARAIETKKVKITHPTAETFSGKVKAGGGCKVDRVVKVKKVDEYGGGGGDALGTARTDESGLWTLTLTKPATAGGYKAVANKTSVEHEDGVLHKCKKGTSVRHPGRLTAEPAYSTREGALHAALAVAGDRAVEGVVAGLELGAGLGRSRRRRRRRSPPAPRRPARCGRRGRSRPGS